MSNLRIFETGNLYGNMNTAKTFYPKCLPAEYRQEDFLRRRIILGEEKGFDGHKFFMASQEDKTGTYHILDENDAKIDDGWKLDIKEDILIITDRVPGVVAGHPVADCPVVMISDKQNGITAVCHCSGALVDKHLPELTYDALRKAGNDMGMEVNDNNIFAYVSSCAGPDWTYNCNPSWATDSNVWQNSIIEVKSDLYKINIRQAVLDQLVNCHIENVHMKLVNTNTHPDYYSHSASYTDKLKAGRNFVGAFYPDPSYEPAKTYYKK